MSTFDLKIVTPDGEFFDGPAERLIVRTCEGEIGILPNHIDMVTALGMGEARVVTEGQTRRAACIGGMVAVTDGKVKVVATTFEWSDKIDLDRAKDAERRAREVLKDNSHSEKELKLAEARLKRALVRESVATRKY